MSIKLVLLDTGVLGLATNPNGVVNNGPLKWLKQLLEDGHQPDVSEIADYELRRELIRMTSNNALMRLDNLGNPVGYLPLDTDVLRRAAALWAPSCSTGQPKAHDQSLDGDVIICTQAEQLSAGNPLDEVIIPPRT